MKLIKFLLNSFCDCSIIATSKSDKHSSPAYKQKIGTFKNFVSIKTKFMALSQNSYEIYKNNVLMGSYLL